MHIMDKYNIVPDPCDNKILRFNNCLQCLSCIVSLLAICIEELREASDIIRFIAHLVFYITSGCMVSQMHYELFIDGPPGSGGTKSKGAPTAETEMSR
jgi:hypothetical protein